MNIILLQSRLTLEEVDQLLKEFPQFLFISLSESTYRNLNPEYWGRIEIIYGSRLTKQDLERAYQLRWIHSPTDKVNRICVDEIEERGNIIVTNTKEEDTTQIGEFVIAIVLGYAKNLFQWWEVNKNPEYIWDSKARETMWTLKGKNFLQIGLHKVGTEIARQAQLQGMHVYGLSETKSFHPYCSKTDTFEAIGSYLAEADYVCLALPPSKQFVKWFDREKIAHLKKDSVLISLGTTYSMDEEALAEAMQAGKLRGAWLDALYQTQPSTTSKLWKAPNLIVTPEVAPRPRVLEKESFRLFKYNLRQFIHGNFNEMRNVVDKSVVFV